MIVPCKQQWMQAHSRRNLRSTFDLYADVFRRASINFGIPCIPWSLGGKHLVSVFIALQAQKVETLWI